MTEELEKCVPRNTEMEVLIKQRIEQATFRKALMDYGGGACAVTSIARPEILRVSHIKPWASWEKDEERLDVSNGFLLCANLNALFDRDLMTFGEAGRLFFSSRISPQFLEILHLNDYPSLRWIAPNIFLTSTGSGTISFSNKTASWDPGTSDCQWAVAVEGHTSDCQILCCRCFFKRDMPRKILTGASGKIKYTRWTIGSPTISFKRFRMSFPADKCQIR